MVVEIEMEIGKMEMKLMMEKLVLNIIKIFFTQRKKLLKIFENNGSWNPVMHGCQFPNFCKLPEEQIWPFPRMVTAT